MVWLSVALLVSTVLLAVGIGTWRAFLAPARRLARAEAATRAGDFARALNAWREVNAAEAKAGTVPPSTRAAHLRAEGRAALALARTAEAERALALASAADPTDPEPWRLRLERLRVLDLPLEASALGWTAYDSVAPAARRGVLRDLTLDLLADLPEDLARATLTRWAAGEAKSEDHDSRVALLRRYASAPRSGDPDRADRIAELGTLLETDPDDFPAREALVSALLDAGEPDRAGSVLDAWPGPESGRDARYWRLVGRLDLDYRRLPDSAVRAFSRALVDLPHDWKTRVRLARALHVLGRETEARHEAEAVSRTREALDPASLGHRLAADLDRLDDPSALADLASLCEHAGLNRLANAWRSEISRPGQPSPR
jgi:thioredoxin-like negative regulator of GroEL